MNTVGIGNPYERELQYYRNECNDLGARLLRLQEEQSHAFLEARRSRTVARLVREAYRFAEPAQAMHDVGGALLQVVVEAARGGRAARRGGGAPGPGGRRQRRQAELHGMLKLLCRPLPAQLPHLLSRPPTAWCWPQAERWQRGPPGQAQAPRLGGPSCWRRAAPQPPWSAWCL